jgi:uncharacterized protein (DUF2062 family)
LKVLQAWARLKRALPNKVELRQIWFFKVFGKTILHPDLWSFQDRAVAGGVALGLLIGCTPTFGIQMFIVAVLAFFLRVNLPLGLAFTWITNLATAPFIYYFCYQVGAALVGGATQAPEPGPLGGKWIHFLQVAKPLWIGSLFVGAIVSLLGYLLTRFVWTLHRKIRRRNITKQEPTQELGVVEAQKSRSSSRVGEASLSSTRLN